MATTTCDFRNNDVTDQEHTRPVRHYRPRVDITESASELTVCAEMPGVGIKNIDINFENGQLTIHGRVASRQGDDTEYLLQEHDIGDFYRTFQVSEQIDANKIEAAYTNGVLTLRLPKVEAAKPRKITVKTA